jgi:hypothetical protein
MKNSNVLNENLQSLIFFCAWKGWNIKEGGKVSYAFV